jgi:hypothetical protein
LFREAKAGGSSSKRKMTADLIRELDWALKIGRGGNGLESIMVRILTIDDVQNLTPELLEAIDDAFLIFVMDQGPLNKTMLEFMKGCGANVGDEEDTLCMNMCLGLLVTENRICTCLIDITVANRPTMVVQQNVCCLTSRLWISLSGHMYTIYICISCCSDDLMLVDALGMSCSSP